MCGEDSAGGAVPHPHYKRSVRTLYRRRQGCLEAKMSGWTEDAKVSGITPKPPCSAESTGTVGTSTVGGSRFYPPSGGASIASGYTPGAVPGRSPAPLGATCWPKGRNQKSAFTQCRDYNTVDKESAVTRQTEESPDAFSTPGRSQLPTLRAVAGFERALFWV